LQATFLKAEIAISISSIETVNGGKSLRTFSAAATNNTLFFFSSFWISLTGSNNFRPLKNPCPLTLLQILDIHSLFFPAP